MGMRLHSDLALSSGTACCCGTGETVFMLLCEVFLLVLDGCLWGLRRCEPESEDSMERTEPVLLDMREGGGGSSGVGGSGAFGSSWGALLEGERVLCYVHGV